jgi:hypothetical protein
LHVTNLDVTDLGEMVAGERQADGLEGLVQGGCRKRRDGCNFFHTMRRTSSGKISDEPQPKGKVIYEQLICVDFFQASA